MKKFTPIAMKCTQEDWESIRGIILKNNIRFDNIENNWEEWCYLKNNGAKDKTAPFVTNIPGGWKSDMNRIVYETFDANIFLNACGIDYYEVIKSEKPTHYQTENNIDIIDFCKMYNLNFNRGNVIKYTARAGKKDDEIKDLEKALDFIQREIKYLKEK